MARIGLIDVDSHNYPNLALMKISAWHKGQGDNVEWYDPFGDRYDVVYKSKVFSHTRDYLQFINADKIVQGGSGYAIKLVDGVEIYDNSADDSLPAAVEHIRPDYALYGIKDTAYGFLSRGCPRGCSFCHVASKEGRKSYKVADLSEFWSGEKNIVLCDPNILACPQREDLLQQLADSGAYVDFNQGLDIRLMTNRMAELVSRIKVKEIHFAWDNYRDKDIILPKLQLYADAASLSPHGHKGIVYVLVNYDTTLDQDLDRIYTLRELGYWAYVMIYDKQHCAPIYKRLQHWCNNRFKFAVCLRFEDFTNTKKIIDHPKQLNIF